MVNTSHKSPMVRLNVFILHFCSSSCMEDGEAEAVANTVKTEDEKKEDVVVV